MLGYDASMYFDLPTKVLFMVHKSNGLMKVSEFAEVVQDEIETWDPMKEVNKFYTVLEHFEDKYPDLKMEGDEKFWSKDYMILQFPSVEFSMIRTINQ